MKNVFLTVACFLVAITMYAQGGQQQLLNRYVGERKITLQWLDTSPTQKCKPGKATISQEEGTFNLSIKGSQYKNDKEFVTIEGTIEPISATEFKFTGTITSQVGFVYDGKPCVKSGTYTFKKWNGRPFYRLQEKTNCDGSAVDYVDIY